MKLNFIKSLIWLGVFATSFSSCDLDVVPPDSMAAENFWKTEKDAWYALNEIYARMPDFLDGKVLGKPSSKEASQPDSPAAMTMV